MAKNKKMEIERIDHRSIFDIYMAIFGAAGGCVGMVIAIKFLDNYFPELSPSTGSLFNAFLVTRGVGFTIGALIGMSAYGMFNMKSKTGAGRK